MPTDASGLLKPVSGVLTRHGVPFALAGAAALAVRGVSRSTLDIDLLVVDPRVLTPAFWADLGTSVRTDIRTGDADDPLAGVVRLSAGTSRDIDVVVGRGAWQAAVIARADRLTYADQSLPVISAADLVLLKLYAGGTQDRWDDLPPGARRLWNTWRSREA
ncbi:MAG: hypothetical protein R2752_02335 [Vicinamibacterales bacterium]